MIEFEKVSVMNFDNAIRGIRNSYESHNKSDSTDTYIGPNDFKLAMNLVKAGASHAKFMRQILVSVDINAPLYWWKEMDQYKVGTVTNSESTMHTIQRESFVTDFDTWDINYSLFSLEDTFIQESPTEIEIKYGINFFFVALEGLRLKFNETKDKRYWRLLIQLLPSGWNQMRTTTMNYSVLANIYHDRKNHRLSEWHDMCRWIETLPYSQLITGVKDEKSMD